MSVDSNISRLIDQFLRDSDERLSWLRRRIRDSRFLPLYVGWSATLGIRCDHTYVRIDNEVEDAPPEEVSDAFSRRLAICQGVKKYPELSDLLPQRPSQAVDCSSCGGAGEIAGAPEIVCECGGIGWLIPGEERVSSAG